MMKDVARPFRALADETRLRILHLLALQEVSVKELSLALNLGQSRVSSQLSQIRETFALRERREGRTAWLRLDEDEPDTAAVFSLVKPQIAATRQGRIDAENLERVVAERESPQGAPAPGHLGRSYLPGRTWEGFARALLHVASVPRALDVGVGDGDMTLLLARACETVVAIDPDRAALSRLEKRAAKVGAANVEPQLGEIEALPVADGDVDLVVASQVVHCADDPAAAIAECARVLAPGGRLLALDLERHEERWVTSKLGHKHLGFKNETFAGWLEAAGFERITVESVARDRKPPHFVTLLATGVLP